jgi:hypothetical protein
MPRQGNGTLAQAIALLIQNQAAFVAELAEANRERTAIERRTEARFRHIEKTMDEMKAMLIDRERVLREVYEMLKELPEAVRQKIGFKTR